jgi:hypothetical protein
MLMAYAYGLCLWLMFMAHAYVYSHCGAIIARLLQGVCAFL